MIVNLLDFTLIPVVHPERGSQVDLGPLLVVLAVLFWVIVGGVLVELEVGSVLELRAAVHVAAGDRLGLPHLWWDWAGLVGVCRFVVCWFVGFGFRLEEGLWPERTEVVRSWHVLVTQVAISVIEFVVWWRYVSLWGFGSGADSFSWFQTAFYFL